MLLCMTRENVGLISHRSNELGQFKKKKETNTCFDVSEGKLVGTFRGCVSVGIFLCYVFSLYGSAIVNSV